MSVDVAVGKLLLCLPVGDALPDVAQLEGLLADELVAGVQVAPGGHRHVLRAAAAAGNPLVNAGTAGQVDHVVVEGEGSSLFVPLQHQLGQFFVLFQHNGQVLLGQLRGITLGADHRLHAQLRKAQIQHLLDVLQKIRVGMGKGTPHIVVLPAPGLYQFLELGHDFLPAAIAGVIYPEPVVHFLPAVQAQHHVAALPVDEIDHILVDLDAVGGQGKAEILPLLLLDAPGIGHQILHHLEVHQRFSAEEVHLQVFPGAGIFHQEIQRPLANLKGHHCPLPVVFALAGKTVRTVQIAGMGHMKAQGLHHPGGFLFQLSGHGGESVGGKELPRLLQLGHLIIALVQLFPAQLGEPGLHQCQDLLAGAAFVAADDFIGRIVHHVDGAGADIQHDVVSGQLVLMNHGFSPFIGKNAAETGGIFTIGCYLLSLFSHFWLAMPQLVLQADWQEVWHSPQPPFLALSHRLRV